MWKVIGKKGLLSYWFWTKLCKIDSQPHFFFCGAIDTHCHHILQRNLVMKKQAFKLSSLLKSFHPIATFSPSFVPCNLE